MTGTVTKSAALSGCRLKGFRLSGSDLGGNTTRGVLVGFLVFVVFAFFSSTVTF